MAMIDVVICNSPLLCWKFPRNDLMLGTQLVVHPSKVAFFVKGGAIYDSFKEGTYTLHTNNIPLLNKLINLPFGKNSPFQAEVWFVDTKPQGNIQWETETPIEIEDPIHQVPINLNAYGTYALKVIEPENFLRTFVGNSASASVEDLDSFFSGQILTHFTDAISKKIIEDEISVTKITTKTLELSKHCNEVLCNVLQGYGLEVQLFSIQSIKPIEDEFYRDLKEGMARGAKFNAQANKMSAAAVNMLQMERSLDVMQTAAGNEGSAGQFVGMGAGLGAGLGVGSAMGNMFSQNLNMQAQAAPPPPPPPQATQYHVLINGTQHGPYLVSSIMPMLQSGQINAETLCWKQGMTGWLPIRNQPEFATTFSAPPPPPPQAAPPPPPPPAGG